MYQLYVKLGYILHLLSLPLARVFIKRTTRVYLLAVKDNRVLVTKNWFGNNLWALPGGGVKLSESPEVALSREVKEEVGLQIDLETFRLLGSGTWQTERLNFKYLIYLTNQSLDQPIKRNKLELADASWVDIHTLNSNNTAEEIIQALSKMA